MNRVAGITLLLFAPTLFSGIVPAAAQPQDRPDPRIRLAQTYERSGRLEEAARLYEELLQTDSVNIVFVDGLRRVSVELKRYDDALALIRSRLQREPRNTPLRAEMGSILYKSGNEQKAFTEWESVIASDSTNPATYRTVAGSLIENRLLERTMETYRRARVNCGDPGLFTIELAQLLSASMDYSGATREYLRWLDANPSQLSFVQARMASIVAKPEGRALAIGEVQSALGSAQSLPLLEFLAWLYLEGKEYREAYRFYREVDASTGAGGVRLLSFAEQAFREEVYDVASDAFLEAIRIPVNQKKLPAARFGYARCLKEMGVMSESGAGEQASERSREAIETFQKIIADYPSSEFSARSFFEIGNIYFERFFDLDRAVAAYNAVRDELPEQNSVTFQALLKKGEVQTAKGDTAAALAGFRTVMGSPVAIPDQQDEATFRIAEILYFGGKFREATDLLNTLTLNLAVDYANDALKLLTFLQENTSSPGTALLEFATADYLARQRKYAEAVPVYFRIAQTYPSSLLVGEALLKAGSLLSESGNYEEAIATYRRLLDDVGETSIALDDAQFAIGVLYQHNLQEPLKAIDAYEELLVRFPRSLHISEARKRIRELRGESL